MPDAVRPGMTMGIAERRLRQKSSLRDTILAAARQMFIEDGYEAVSMRKLAERIEYSPTAIYLHFADKDALFRTVCDETFARLVKRLEKARAKHAGDPLGWLRAGLEEYIRFGLNHPEHYAVTFLQRQRGSQTDFEGSSGERAFAFLREAVAQCDEAGLLRPMRREVAAQVLWVSIHGLVALLIVDESFPFAPRQTLIDAQLETLLAGLMKGPAGG
ncbi:MAG: TetR/AcrR family transcriptional regulator [Alphaproteobacteria bacterium]